MSSMQNWIAAVQNDSQLIWSMQNWIIAECVFAGHGGGETFVGRLVAKRFGSYPEPFPGRVGYFAPRLCPAA